MNCFSESLRARFTEIGEVGIIDSLEAAYSGLLERRRHAVEYGDLSTISESARAGATCRVQQQVLLHRAERLLVSSGSMISENNIYGLALIIRGHLETTAVLGYLCQRLQSFEAGNLRFEDIILNIAVTGLGAKHEQFKDAPAPVNIITCIAKSDRYLMANGLSMKEGMIADCYAWLSDFAHPNFLSHSSAIEVEPGRGEMRFRHGLAMLPQEMSTLGYLDISAGLFLWLYDDLGERAAKAFPVT